MKKKLKRVAYSFSKPFSVQTLRKWTGQNFIFPFYHLISDSPPPYVKHLFPVTSISQFKKDLDFLLSNYSTANIDDVLDFIKNGKKSKKPMFYLSFDDGFSECANIIAPILKEKGISAAFFINPAFSENKQLSHRQKVSLIIDKLQNNHNSNVLNEVQHIISSEETDILDIEAGIKKLVYRDKKVINTLAELLEIDFQKILSDYTPYLNLEEIKQLQEDRFTIGSHSYSHPEFYDLDDQMRINQIVKSFNFLYSKLNVQNRYFSFPFTDDGVPASFFNYLKNESKIRVSFGTAGIKNDSAPYHIQRIPIETAGFPTAESIIRAEYFYYLGKAIFRKNTIVRK